MKKLIILSLLVLAGCFQTYNPDDDFRTVPVTNNPNIVPNYGNGLPGMGGGGGQQGPY
jgi:hypothetical protein